MIEKAPGPEPCIARSFSLDTGNYDHDAGCTDDEDCKIAHDFHGASFFFCHNCTCMIPLILLPIKFLPE